MSASSIDLARAEMSRTWIGVAIGVNIVLPMCLFPFKSNIYQYSPIAFWAFVEFFSLVLPLLSALLLWRKLGVVPERYGLRIGPRNWIDTIGLGLLCSALFLLAYWPTNQIGFRFLAPEILSSGRWSYANLLQGSELRVPVLSLLSIQAGVFESIIFVGWPWLLSERFSKARRFSTSFVMLTAIAFSLSHYANGMHEVIATLLLGIVVSSLFLKLKDLWPLVIGHTVLNLVVVV